MTSALQEEFKEAVRRHLRATVAPSTAAGRALYVGHGAQQRRYTSKELGALVDSLMTAGSATAKTAESLFPALHAGARRGRVEKAIYDFYDDGRHFDDMKVLAGAVADRLAHLKRVEDTTWSEGTDDEREADGFATHPEVGDHPDHAKFTAVLAGFLEPGAVEELWQLTLKGVDWARQPGRTEEELKKNPVYPELARKFRTALTIPRGERLALWSGGYDVRMYASERRFVTLETTRAGHLYNQLSLFDDWSVLGGLWKAISREFAGQAPSEVHVFVRYYNPDSILFGEELPQLLRLQTITSLRWHLVTGDSLKDMSDVDDSGRRVTSFTFGSYHDMVAVMSSDKMNNNKLGANRASKNLTAEEKEQNRLLFQQQIKDDVAAAQKAGADAVASLREDVKQLVSTLQLDESYNDNPAELRDKQEAVGRIVDPVVARVRNGLVYDRTLADSVSTDLNALAQEMDRQYIRKSLAVELRRHAETVTGKKDGLEEAIGIAIERVKEGMSLENAKLELGQMLR
ncbi:hypothetical protein [Umezawaea tangerina]|uniref:Uncharacterized protein n=1 Tax=Umezawaea tangerina TaxID=84725 RepID=A0A2T0T089_9PSEU|nr:hypothetical protein [Umezawaea tangerina]PRY39076.1 hypothetical protein CLV43_108476 [Umezawaea tangerina]